MSIIPRNGAIQPARSKKEKSLPMNNNSSNKVRVVARIRPLAKYELQKGSEAIVTKVPGSLGQTETLEVGSETNANGSNANANNNSNRWFELDAVLDETCDQQEVYEQSGAQTAVAKDLFLGYNATILAYGQTGSGKTYTMGTASNPANEGVIPRACKDLFANVRLQCDQQAQVTCSYMEVYNEEIRDLLVESSAQQPPLRIRETLDGQVYVRGLTERPVQAPQEVYAIMAEANQRRVVASTKMNATSSRSHAICVLKIKGVIQEHSSRNNSSDNNNNSNSNNSSDPISRTFESKLTLVDLAGSERLKKTQAQGNRAKEGISINKGLFVLGKVVSALSEQGSATKSSKKQQFLPKPPYRDSKLTRLLQDSLGGNSRTIMIACVSPANYNVEETINTLRYATQARKITNTSTANLVETNISQAQARKLKRENALLKAQIEELEATISKLTEVNEEDLEKSLSIIQQQKEDPCADEKKIETIAIERKNRSSDENSENTPKSNNKKIALEDHFSQHESSSQQDNNDEDDDDHGDEDKDSVSMLSDDIFHRSPFGRKAKLSRRLSRTNSQASFNSTRTMEEVEEENTHLAARLLLAEQDVRASARDTAVELPKLKKRVQELEDDLSESKWLEQEAKELREQLGEARADKESAQKAAQQLTNFMKEQKLKTGFRGDEITLTKVTYSRHKFNEDWVRFLVVVLKSFKEELRVLGDYFQMVVQVVELNNRERKGGFASGFGWWKSEDQKGKELSTVAAEKELRNTLLKEHIRFFNERLVEVEDKVNLGSESIDVVLETLGSVRAQMEAGFDSEEEVESIRDLYSKKGERLISELTDLMAGKLLNPKFELVAAQATAIGVH